MTRGVYRRSTACRFIALAAVFFCASVFVLMLDCQEQKPSHTQHGPRSSETIAGGRGIFESVCAACHGLDGRGGERGPNIRTRSEALSRSDKDLLKLLQDGLPDSGMPPFESLGVPKLKALVAYLRALQGSSKTSPLPGNPQKGKSLFFGKAACGDCHMVNGSGGFLGADLSSYASNASMEEIREAITDPNKDLDLRARTVFITTRDGRQFTGIARNEDNFSLQLQSVDGVFHLFAKSDLQTIEYQPKSLMPSDYGSVLSRPELNDLVSFLISSAWAAKEAPSSQTKAMQEKEDD
jgi:cytochrome c oxidase cbb3-type subunit 3